MPNKFLAVVHAYAWAFMAIPAVSYALWAVGLKLSGKPWTAAAWLCYVGANVCFLVALLRGE